MGEGNWVELEPAQLKKLAGPFEYKAVGYADLAGYQAGLATEVAAGWDVIGVTPGDRALNAGTLVVTYRRAAA